MPDIEHKTPLGRLPVDEKASVDSRCVLFSHPLGNPNVREAALAFEGAGLLSEYWTCVSWNPESRINSFLPANLRDELCRRALPRALLPRARYAPLHEIGRMLSSKCGLRTLLRHEEGIFSIDAVNRALDRRVASRVARSRGLRAVYAYEDGAAETFAAAARCGLTRFYDLPIGYWRAGHAIYREEKIREPEWACTLSGALDSPEKLERKDEELRLANAVIVASSFTKSTLSLSPRPVEAVHVVPYGAPVSTEALSPRESGNGRLRVLFAGALGQRKGISYLLDAVSQLKGRVELTLLGRKTSEVCRPLNDAVTRYRWIPSLSHRELLAEMRRHDVLVFPSLFEGFGLVILEAMAQGLPVIATPHSAGPDIIEEGRDGFIVPVRSSAAIAEKLDLLASDCKLLEEMSLSSRRKAAFHTWEVYRERLVRVALGGIAGIL
jgi:starch synthase